MEKTTWHVGLLAYDGEDPDEQPDGVLKIVLFGQTIEIPVFVKAPQETETT